MSSTQVASSQTYSNSRVDTEIDLQANLQLLRDIHGFLTSSLSAVGSDGCKPLIQGKLVTLGLTLGQLSPTLHEINDIKYEVLEQLDSSLRMALHNLNAIITDKISAIIEEHNVSWAAPVSSKSQEVG